MATKSIKSSGTQITQRGVNQGNVVVDPVTGLPVSVITDSQGKKRLAVDANITATIPNVDVDVEYHDDSVAIGDPNTNTTLKINPNGSIDSNVEVDAADGDNIAIHDSNGDELNINPDGSINVNLTASNPGDLLTFYNEVTSVATSVLTTVQTFTAPVGKTSFIQKVEVSGTNIAEYSVYLNATLLDKKRTYFGENLNEKFVFAETGTGLKISVGDVITVKVIHLRPNVADFNSRIQVVEA